METNKSLYPRVTIKKLLITKPNQKIRFQIRHPENAAHIIGLTATCSQYPQSTFTLTRGSTVGYLTLSIAEKGDLAFGQDVKWDKNTLQDITEKKCQAFQATPIAKIATQQSYFETDLEITKAVMEGFYEDVFLDNDALEISQALFSVPVPVLNPLGEIERGETPIPPDLTQPIAPSEMQPYWVNIYVQYLIRKIKV